jgi:Cdc6-like AAA superfamily ATPase
MELFDSKDNELLNQEKFSFKIYVNCMSVNSISDFYVEVFNYFKKDKNLASIRDLGLEDLLSQQTNNKNLIILLDALTKAYKPIVVLDEIDHFYKKSKDIDFFELLKVPYLTDCDFKMIIISNNPEFDKEILPKLGDKKIQLQKIVFAPYTHVAIYEILLQKLKENDTLQYFHEDALRLISKKFERSGDLRPALELVKNLLLINKTDLLDNKKKIELKDVLPAINRKNTTFVDLMNNLTVEQKLVIAAIYFVMINKNVTEEDEREVKI